MGRRTALLHIGPLAPHAPHDLHHRLAAHADLLGPAGLALTPAPPGLLESAAIEMLRQHREAGLRRRDVEGSWSQLCRNAERSRSHALISQPRFAAATGEQAALVLDGLAAFDVHLALTAYDAAHDVGAVLDTWAPQLHRERVHVLRLDEDAAPVDVAEELAGLAWCLHRQRTARQGVRAGRHRTTPRRRLALLTAS